MTATLAAICRKYFRCLKLYSKLIGEELPIIIIPFEKRKIKVHIFERVTFPGFSMRDFRTKYDFNTKKQVLLPIKLKPCLLKNENTCCIKAKCFLF